MTITVICGEGHINKYNLVNDQFHKCTTDEEGNTHVLKWNWEHWKCPTKECKHKEYINHVTDKTWTETHGEESSTNPQLLAALLLLSIILSMKTRLGL